MKKRSKNTKPKPKKFQVVVDRTEDEKREKGSLVKEKKKYQKYMFKGHKIPQLLRGAQQHIFGAIDKKIKSGYLHEYTFNQNGTNFKVKWKITPTLRVIDKGKLKGETINLGRLNDTDLRVWNCILKIARDQNFNKGFKTNKIKITRYEIAKMLNVKPTNTSYQMIDESFYRLAWCPTELIITNEEIGEELLVSTGGYLDEYVLYDIRGRSKSDEKQIDLFTGTTRFSYVVINKRRFEEIKGGYITKISFDILLNKLSTPLARCLYSILNVRDQENPVKLSMTTLKELTGQVKLRSSKILNAAAELKKYKFLKDFHRRKYGRKVFLIFVLNQAFYDEEHKQYEIEHETDPFYKLVMKVLNLTLPEAKEKVIEEFPDEDIIKYLKYLVYELKKGSTIDNRLGWFLKAIKENWALPVKLRKNWKNNKVISSEDMLNI